MILNRFLLTVFLISLAFSCKEVEPEPNPVTPPPIEDRDADGVDDDNEGLVLGEGQFATSGTLELPDGIDPSSLSISTTAGVYEIASTGEFNAARTGFEKQFLFAVDAAGEILLSSIVRDGSLVLNSASTAETLVAMHPATSSIPPDQLPSFIEAMKKRSEYDDFLSAVEGSVAKEISPLTNPEVLSAFQVLFDNVKGASGGRKAEVIEVDYLVEPRIEFLGNQFRIRNDGTTTAAWGVEVFHEETSLTDALVLPGNEVRFPGLSSIWNAFAGDFSEAVFEEGDELLVPVTGGKKFMIRFASPTSPDILDSELAREALEYNVCLSVVTLWNAIGLPGLKSSDYIDIYECGKEPIDAATDVIVAAIHADKFNTAFLLDQVATVFNQGVDMFANCTALFNNFPGSQTTSLQHYIGKLAKFLQFYSRAEAAFTLGKRVGDMLVLSDIEVCRQIVQGQMFPCFSLVKDVDYDSIALLNELITLEVQSKLDVAPPEVTAYPVGALIEWKVTKGDGRLSITSTPVKSDGTASVSYYVGVEDQHVITAYIEDADGKIIDKIDYPIRLNDIQEMSAYINGAYWQADDAYYSTSKFNNGTGTATSYQRFVSGRREVNIGEITSVSLQFESHSTPYDLYAGHYPLGVDFNRDVLSGFAEGMAVSIWKGGGSSSPYWANANASVTITSVADGIIEGTFSFQVTEKGAEGEEDKVLYDVTNGYFKTNRWQ